MSSTLILSSVTYQEFSCPKDTFFSIPPPIFLLLAIFHAHKKMNCPQKSSARAIFPRSPLLSYTSVWIFMLLIAKLSKFVLPGIVSSVDFQCFLIYKKMQMFSFFLKFLVYNVVFYLQYFFSVLTTQIHPRTNRYAIFCQQMYDKYD